MIRIPNYSNYLIDLYGNVYSEITNSWLEGSINPAGYCHFRLQNNNGETRTIGRHRLMCMVFNTDRTKGPVDTDELYVNHINGVKGDDRIENLEWVTPQENVLHAGSLGITEKCIPVMVKHHATGEVHKFPSYLSCAEFVGISRDAVSYRFRYTSDRLWPEGYQYSHIIENYVWPTVDAKKAEMLNGTTKTIDVRNVLSDIVVRFDKLSDAASFLKIAPSTLTGWLKLKDQPVLPGFVQFKMGHDDTPWRLVDDPYIEIAKTTGRSCVKVTHPDGSITIYESAKHCCDAIGVKPTTLNNRLKTCGQHTFPDGCKYGYYPY